MDKITQDRIEANAKTIADNLAINSSGDVIYKVGHEEGYIAGATAEHERAQMLPLLPYTNGTASPRPPVPPLRKGTIERS